MKIGDRIFVYGTLRPGQGANYILGDGRAEHIGSDRIVGNIHHLGGFPGLKLQEHTLEGAGSRTILDFNDKEFEDPDCPFEKNVVVGDLYEIKDEALPKRLDWYEGYPSLYDRRRVTTENGVETWVYVLQGIPPEGSRIESGEWTGRESK